MYNIGCMYYTGEGVEQNTKKAIEWYKKAIEDRYEKAQEKLDEILKKV